MRSECGARARNDTLRTRAASGIMLTGTTTGPGGAFPGLGQAGAGNARVRARGPSLPGWSDRTGSNVLPRPRKPGLELRPRAESPDGKSRGGTPIGERAPSLPSPASGRGERDKGARRIARCGGWLNTSVGVPLPFFLGRRSPDEAKRNPGSSIQAGTPFPDFASLHPGYSSYRTQNSGADRVAGTHSLIRPPRSETERGRGTARLRGGGGMQRLS